MVNDVNETISKKLCAYEVIKRLNDIKNLIWIVLIFSFLSIFSGLSIIFVFFSILATIISYLIIEKINNETKKLKEKYGI